MESMSLQNQDSNISNGDAHGTLTTMNNPSKPDQQPTTPESPCSPSTPESPQVISPPYWAQSHTRSVSNISIESIVPGTITLQDNTEGHDDNNRACWAKGVHIDDYVVVNGSRTGIGAFVVWNVTVETLSVSATVCAVPLFGRAHVQIGDADQFRAHPFIYGSDTQTSTTFEISFCRHSPFHRPPCRHCPLRA